MKSIEKLLLAIKAFHEAGIRFVLIGGLAMIVHGANTLTQDVDIAYMIETDNLDKLANFLSTIHPRILGRPRGEVFAITSDILRKVRFLNLSTDLGVIDVMREIPGVDSLDNLLDRTVLMDLGGFTVPVASLDDLIAMKRAANRPKDQLHLLELLALKKLKEASE